ncbi:LIN37 [Lepeophtheirus salmonis]|uniref:LIN37 n=1 Tax=Lepeophtheirus salmonis TaxID=72036 RepID=A0A7R8CJ33_LEPSM|nr:LIN37 [Lepeophtheirus salmonis]CAF2838027.1 LIN37 [Lepeophtheirus salmonis]
MVKDEIFTARDRFNGALQFAVDKVEEVKTRSPIKKEATWQLGSNSANSSPVKHARNSPSHRSLTQISARKRKRKDVHMDLGFHHTFVMKLFDRNPLNKRMLPRIRTPTPEPPSSEGDEKSSGSPNTNNNNNNPENEFLSDEGKKPETSNLDEGPSDIKKSKKGKQIYKMPIFEPLEANLYEKEFVSPRIPQPFEMERDESFDVNKFQEEDSPSPAILLGDHMVRWCQVRKRWENVCSKE